MAGDFGIFFDGRTPQDLLSGTDGPGVKKIYDALALALYSGACWPVSVALVAKVIGAVDASRRCGTAFFTAGATRSAASAAPLTGASSSPPDQPVHAEEETLSEELRAARQELKEQQREIARLSAAARRVRVINALGRAQRDLPLDPRSGVTPQAMPRAAELPGPEEELRMDCGGGVRHGISGLQAKPALSSSSASVRV